MAIPTFLTSHVTFLIRKYGTLLRHMLTTKNTMSLRSANYCYTLNNYTDEEIQHIESMAADCKYLVYGKEIGPECGTPHIHVYMELEKQCRIGAARKLVPIRAADFDIRRGTAAEASAYCKKDGDFKEFGAISVNRMHSGTAQPNKNDSARIILACKTKKEALAKVIELAPHDYLIHYNNINNTLTHHFPQQFEHKYSKDDFDCPLIPTEELKERAILLAGPSGYGKTQWALTHFKNPLLVRHMDKLKELTDANDGIVFDDLSFKHYPPEAVIHLLDMEEDSDIHVRYAVASIPKMMPRVFTHNTTNPFYTVATTDIEQQNAIKRRFKLYELEKCLF